MLIETSVQPGLTQAGGVFTQPAVAQSFNHQISVIVVGALVSRVAKLISGTNSTQKVRLGQITAKSVTTVQTGLTDYKIALLGGLVFDASANIVDNENGGLYASKVNLPAGVLFNGFQYWARDRGARGSLEIYNKTLGKWCQPVPVNNTAPTTGTWERGDVVFNMYASAGERVGWICTGAGTPGTWEPFGQAGMVTSVAAAPGFIGQSAVVGAAAYIAVGTSTSADWKLIT